jgi:AP-4 complex subunit beta-1
MSATGGNPYFVDPKKGEVNELRALLTNVNIMREQSKKREVIKKVIGYMTLGIDVSSLFPNMVMQASTNDMIVKKMVYMYLTKYALENSELALLCVNTLCKDCEDMDPMIRGLALRALSGLRLASLVEYILRPLGAGLKDKSAYVRKTAVVGVMKIFHVVPETIEEAGYIDTVKAMINDRDPQVVSNVIVCLSEVLRTKGGISINRPLCVRLLKKIKSFNDWSQCIVLEFLWHYEPSSNQECFHIMNALDSCLVYSHSGVVLAAAKIFLKYGEVLGDNFSAKIFQRLKTPFLTLLANPSPESDYIVLCHIKVCGAVWVGG